MISIYNVGSINISGMFPTHAFRIPGPYPLKAFEQTIPLPDPNTPGMWRREGEKRMVSPAPVEKHWSKQKKKSKGQQDSLNKKYLLESKSR